jgi:Tetratricopeptide repeat
MSQASSLPSLAIVQAVAFLNENDVQMSEYISLYKDTEENRIDLLSQDFEDQSRYRETKNPVAITWYISFEQIQKQDPLAADYLSFMACVACESIPTSLLLSGRSTITQKKAIGTLTAYAFVASQQRPQKQEQEVGVGEACFDVHQLVHLATRNWLRSHGQWPVWIDKALMRLVDIVPFGGHERREVWVAYLPHAIHVATLPDLPKTEAWISLLDRIGSCQHSLGQYKAAEGTHRQILGIRRKELGKQHPDTLTSMKKVAQALRHQGKYVKAEKMHQETLALRKKVSGTEHSYMLTSMNNVAQALGETRNDEVSAS